MATTIQADEIHFIEDFALATDRSKPLQQLIPGTEDYYYYHALHYQNLEQFDEVESLLKRWIKQHDYTNRVREIQHRQALLTYSANPKKSLEFIRRTLGLTFNHQRQSATAQRQLPTRLDEEIISRAALARRAFRQSRNLQGFSPRANEWLVDEDLTPDQRRDLLSRLRRPDYSNLVELIVKDLNHKGSRGFGSHQIHGQLLIAQLEACIERKPTLLNDENLVKAYLAKLQPNGDVDIEASPNEQRQLLERQWKFVSRLAPSHNSLKAHVLYHRLVFDRKRGEYNKQRFMTYLRLPRKAGYVSRNLLETDEARRYVANLGQDFSQFTTRPSIGSDEALVRDYLSHYFVKESSYRAYESYIDSTYLKQLFAETKLLHGLGDAERWYAMLPPEQLQRLRDRIDLDFVPTNKQYFQVNEGVGVDLDVKNIKKLIVKIYEINTLNYFREHGRDVNTDINLDGLIANRQKTFTYDEPPLHRVRRHFDFPSLSAAGVYVVDFVGNGKSSRMVIRKGQLRALHRVVAQGHLFTILDDENEPLAGAHLWLEGHQFTANDNGQLVVPYTSQPGKQAFVLTHDGRSSVDVFPTPVGKLSVFGGLLCRS